MDIDKLKPVSTDLNKLSDVVKNNVVKKSDYNTKITEIEGKIPDISDLIKKTKYSSKITEIEDKIPDTNNLATKTALTTAGSKIPSISNLVKKQTTIPKLLILKINLIIMIMTNILILQNLKN